MEEIEVSEAPGAVYPRIDGARRVAKAAAGVSP